jgi:fumarylacetoacetase
MPLMRSWVDSANRPEGEFPLNNLPCGVFVRGEDDPRCGMAIGDFVLDLTGLEAEGLIELGGGPLLDVPFWNEVMEAGPAVWADLRAQVTALLKHGATKQYLVEDHLVPLTEVSLQMPFLIAEYTDFYAGRNHAFNVGTMFRGPENALPPNWLHIPIGYNGRASSVVVSGTPVRRPWGQVKGPDFAAPAFQPSRRFDIELELGCVLGQGSTLGAPVTVAEAEAMIFGFVLLNDWSARDIQAWEYQPLGPFQAKATATTISPWIVMKSALDAFRIPTPPREVPLLPYLSEPGPLNLNIDLTVTLTPPGTAATVISHTNSRELYYAFPQQIAHHTSSGCAMSVGDLIGSGTISGADPGTQGSLLELSWGGKTPLAVGPATRSFIEDNDILTLTGHALGDGFRIGFGACTGQVLPALPDPYAR